MLASSGCGGGSARRLTQGDFALRANAACKHANDEIEALPIVPPAPTSSELGAFLVRLEPIVAAQTRDLHRLTPPAKDQSQWDKFLGDSDFDIAQLDKVRAAAVAGRSKDLQKLQGSLRDTDPIATRLGLGECARKVQPQGPNPTGARARFIATADALCKSVPNVAVPPVQRPVTPAGIFSAQVRLYRQGARLGTIELERLRKLTPPVSDRAVVADFLAAQAKRNTLVSQIADAWASGKGPTGIQAEQLDKQRAVVARLAQSYGFRYCGRIL